MAPSPSRIRPTSGADASVLLGSAWDDYHGRILELKVHGYAQDWEGAAEHGKRWLCELSRGAERISVTIERTA